MASLDSTACKGRSACEGLYIVGLANNNNNKRKDDFQCQEMIKILILLFPMEFDLDCSSGNCGHTKLADVWTCFRPHLKKILFPVDRPGEFILGLYPAAFFFFFFLNFYISVTNFGKKKSRPPGWLFLVPPSQQETDFFLVLPHANPFISIHQYQSVYSIFSC